MTTTPATRPALSALTTTVAATALVGCSLAGCSGVHVALDDAAMSQSDAAVLAPDAAVAPDAAHAADAAVPPGALEGCLLGGGSLVEVARVFNNDVHDHGALVTFGVSETGTLAAAGADGTLKFWGLDAALLGVVDASLLTYGSEISAPITDMVLSGERVIAGDARGLVSEMQADGTILPRGGTTPDVPIVAVAYWPSADAAGDRLAHAQRAEGLAPLTVRDATSVLELSSDLLTIQDLAYAGDGTLWVGGARQDGERVVPAVEIRDAVDPSHVVRTIDVASDEGGAVSELAISWRGDVLAVRTPERVEVHRGDAITTVRFEGWAEIVGEGVALGTSGEVLFTVESDGTLRAHAVDDGRSLTQLDVGSRPVAVRTDASGRLVVVGRADAYLIAYACE